MSRDPLPGDPELVAEAQNGLPGKVTLRPAGVPAAPQDPVEEYMAARRSRMAQALREQEIRDLEADAELERRKKQAEVMKVEAEIAELKNKLRAAEPEEQQGPQSLIAALISTLNADKNRAYSEAKELRDALQQQLLQTVQSFREEAREKSVEPPNPALDLSGRITELKAIREVMTDLFPPRQEAPISSSIEETIRLYQIQEAHEARMAELSLMRDERMRRLDMEQRAQDAQEERLRLDSEVQQRRTEVMARALEQATPAIAQAFTRAITPDGGGGAPTFQAEPPAPEVRAAMVAPDPAGQQQVGEGYVAITCPACQQAYRLPDTARMGQCPSCQQVVRLQEGGR